jgi:hypothetical protein
VQRTPKAILLSGKTIVQRMRATLHAIKAKLRQRLDEPVNAIGDWLKRVVDRYLPNHRCRMQY